MKSKSICLIIPSLTAGGMERVMSEIANFLANDKNITVNLILTSKNTIFYNLSNEIRVYNLKEDKNLIKKLYWLRKLIIEIKPYSVLSFGSMYNSFVMLALYGIKTKIYLSDRSNPFRNTILKFKKGGLERHDGPLHFFLKKYLYRRAEGILSQTKMAIKIDEVFLKHNNIIYFPNPIRSINYRKSIKKENLILNVGRFVSTKNQKDLIDIFEEINNSNWKLIFVGDGPMKNEMIAYAETKQTNNHIEFVGNIVNVDDYYRKAKIFAFTSLSEGFPNVLAEALMANLSLISYDCVAGPADLIEDDFNGYLIPVKQRELYKIKLKSLMRDKTLREKFVLNSQTVKSRYEKTTILNKLKHVLLN